MNKKQFQKLLGENPMPMMHDWQDSFINMMTSAEKIINSNKS